MTEPAPSLPSPPTPAPDSTYTGGLKGPTGIRSPGRKPGGGSTTGLKTGGEIRKNEIARAIRELERMDRATMDHENALIAQRLVAPNPRCQAIARSLKTKAPPPPPMMFAQLQPGDVLLVAPEDTLTFAAWIGHYIRLFDKLSSWEWDSRASHTLIFLREVKGKKLFLDNLPGEGPRVKTEDQVIGEYGMRSIDVAQPTSRPDGKALWEVARELGIKQITADLYKLADGELIRPLNRWTNYGLFGNGNMVCSEASRFILAKAGLEIPDSESPIKRLLGIYFGPANFYNNEQYFLVTPLEKLPKKQ